MRGCINSLGEEAAGAGMHGVNGVQECGLLAHRVMCEAVWPRFGAGGFIAMRVGL